MSNKKKFQKELLKNKYLKECEKNNALQLLNNQITAMVEESRTTIDNKTGKLFILF